MRAGILATLLLAFALRADGPATTILVNPTAPAPAIEAPLEIRDEIRTSSQPVFGMDILLGQLSGIRPHVAVWRGPTSSLVVEGFYGATLTKFGASEAVGGGVRWNFGGTSTKGVDTVLVGPGIDVLQNLNGNQATILVPSVDFTWRRTFGERAGITAGLSAGLGIGAGGTYKHDKSAAGRLTPVISGIIGLRF